MWNKYSITVLPTTDEITKKKPSTNLQIDINLTICKMFKRVKKVYNPTNHP